MPCGVAGSSLPIMNPVFQYTDQNLPQIPRHDIIRALADIAHTAADDAHALRFRVLAPDQSLFDTPTFSVEILQNDCNIGTYKFNALADYSFAGAARAITFSPLVIQWAEGGKFKQSGMDKAIINHCLQTIRCFIDRGTYGYDTAILTTAYLTKQRGGKQFFEALGWHVIEYDTTQAVPTSEPLLADAAARIEILSAPHRTSAAERHHACFAYIVI